MARQLFEQGCLLPIGRCDASFAANCPPDGDVPYLTAAAPRTTDQSLAGKDHPSYNIVALPVTAEEFDAIEAVYHRTGAPRMRVTRVIDLANVLSAELPDLHVLVFQYGDAELVRTTSMVIDFARASASTGRPPEYLKAVLSARLPQDGLPQLAQATDIATHAPRTLARLDGARASGAPTTPLVPAQADWAAELRERAGASCRSRSPRCGPTGSGGGSSGRALAGRRGGEPPGKPQLSRPDRRRRPERTGAFASRHRAAARCG